MDRDERQDLLPRHGYGRGEGDLLRDDEREDAPAAAGRYPGRALVRQQEYTRYDSIWDDVAGLDTAVSRDLAAKAKRWKMLAWEPIGQTGELPNHEHPLHTGCSSSLEDIDRHEVAAMYVKDALAGRECVPCIHDKTSLNALKLVRNKTWNQVLNVCTIVQLALPMLEIQRCLPCFGPQKLSYPDEPDLLHIGWRPTPLGSMWLECLLCLLYVYDVYQVILSNGGGRAKPRWWWWHRTTLPRWQVVRTWLVFILALGLLTNILSHYLLRVTWHRWSRVTLPFLLISRRTYLKLFVGGVIKVLPGMVPVIFLMSFVVFFYAFMAYVLHRTAPRDPSFLSDLGLFEEPLSSALTFLRMFMSIPFMMDVEILYYGNKSVQAISLSYGVIMVIFLGALVPAVANRNFQYQFKESFTWMNEQRKLALTRAYLLVRNPTDRMVHRKDWVDLMLHVNPDCERESAIALFRSAKKAERDMSPQNDDTNRISKGGFFMMCALGKARFSQKTKSSERKRPSRARRWLRENLKGWSQQIYILAILVQGYQIVREGDDPDKSPPWTNALGACLIAYFSLNACCRMLIKGPIKYFMKWRRAVDMVLNIVGVAFYCGLWIRGEQSRRVYHILQAVRIVVLWSVLHRLGKTTSEVARRLELVFPDLLRSSFVLFSVTYSYSIVAYALYCHTPLGQEPRDSVSDDSMFKRWASYQDVGSFGSMLQSFASMTDVIMLSNWPMFMDAAGVVGNTMLANIFFFSFKGLTFYFVMPVMLGFIVQSYMAAKLPGQESNQPPLAPVRSISPKGPGESEDGGGAAAASGREGLVRDRTASSMSSTPGARAPSSPTRSIPRRPGLNREDNPGPISGSAFGYTTLADGHGYEIGIDKESVESDNMDTGDGSDYDDDDVKDNVVMVTGKKRSMSMAFWSGEQAKQDSANLEVASSLEGNLTRLQDENNSLQDENNSLQDENKSLQALVEKLEIQNRKLLEEAQKQAPKELTWSPLRALSRKGEDAMASNISPATETAGSGNSSIAMEAIVEARDDEVDIV